MTHRTREYLLCLVRATRLAPDYEWSAAAVFYLETCKRFGLSTEEANALLRDPGGEIHNRHTKDGV